jgi:acetyl esterase
MKKNSDAPVWNLKGHERMMTYYFPNMSREEIQELMPMQQELPQFIPDTYVETAEFDILHDEGILYAKKLEAAGARVEINETARTFHGYDAALNSKIARMNIEKRIDFLKRAFS